MLKTFPDDVGIRNASLDLIVVTLQAIERVIGFYISKMSKLNIMFLRDWIRSTTDIIVNLEAVRTVKALGMGDQYGRKLVQSLDDIETKSKRLLDEGQKAHLYASHTCMSHSKEEKPTFPRMPFFLVCCRSH